MRRAWWKEAVVYQIYPRSFADANGDGIGDLPGIIGKLDYLAELGVDVLWLNPIYPSPNDDNGYDIADYRGIHPDFGTRADFAALLAAVHRRGMRLVMDLVVNHTSDEHPWFAAARSARDNPQRDWYIWRPGRGEGPPNNWRSAFGGSAWEYDAASGEYYLHLFSRKQPDLNWDNPAVRREIYAMMRWWLDQGIDGFRMDVITLLQKPPGLPDVADPFSFVSYSNHPGMHEILAEMHTQVLRHYDCMTVGEAPGQTPQTAQPYVDHRRRELNMLFQFENVEAAQQFRWSLAELKRVTRSYYAALWGTGWPTQFIGNHDTPRAVSCLGDDGPHRIASAQLLATANLTLPGTPYIYQGDEIGMTNVAWPRIEDYDDIMTRGLYQEMVRAGAEPGSVLRVVQKISRDNARTPFHWDGGPNAGFSRGRPWLPVNPNYSQVNLAADRRAAHSVSRYYQQLIALRRRTPALVYGRYRPLLAADPDCYVYERTLPGERILVVLNWSGRERRLTLPPVLGRRPCRLLLANAAPAEDGGGRTLALAPWAARLYRLE